MSEYSDGFNDALGMMNLEVDKILSRCYNDVRARDNLLDIKNCIKTLRLDDADSELASSL